MNVKFGTGERTSSCQISRLPGQECGNTAPKLSKFRILAINLPLRGDSFAVFFNDIPSVCTRLQVAFKILIWSLSGDKQPRYKHFPAVGAFSLKFSIAPTGETKDRIKKVKGCKNGTDLLYHHAKYGGDRGSRAGWRRKSDFFYWQRSHAGIVFTQ